MKTQRLAAGLLAAFALLATFPAAALPGDLDASFGTGGVAALSAFGGDDTVNGAVGTTDRWVTGSVVRGGAVHLYVAKFTAAGALDPTFGTGGKSMLRWDYSSQGNAIAQQADGKLVVAGVATSNIGTHMLVTRFNTDGTLDTTFGTNGVTTANPMTNGYSQAYAVAIAADGKIVVAGTATLGTSDMAVLRLTTAGALDATFGTGGMKLVDFRGGMDGARAVQLTAAGKILVAGIGAQSSANANLDFAVARLNTDGSVDTTFGPPGQNGLALYDVGGGYDDAGALAIVGTNLVLGGTSQRTGETKYTMSALRLTADGLRDPLFGANGAAFATATASLTLRNMAVQADGKVVLASNGRPTYARLTTAGALDGTFGGGGLALEADTALLDSGVVFANGDGTITSIGSRLIAGPLFGRDVAFIRYTASGARDATFGGGSGLVATNLFTMNLDARAVAITPDDKILVAGMLSDTFDADAAVTRLTPQGAKDGSFGNGSVRAITFGASDDIANAIVVLGDGSSVLAGRMNLLGTSSFLVAKLDQYGQPVTTFGNTGRTVHTMGIGYAEAFALAMQPDGKIVSAGYAVVGAGNNDFALARYDQSGYLDATFGTNGVVITPFGALSDVAQAVAIQPDGKIVAAGYTRVGSLFDIALARYNADGSLDATFGTGGKAVIPASASNDQGAAIAITREGKILVAGYLVSGTNQNIAVVRVNANGTLDTTFGTSGIASVDIAGGADQAWGMALQRNGKILLAGPGFDGAGTAFAAVRLNDDGTRDTRFGTNGVRTIDVSVGTDTARAVAVQPDGRIVVAGTAGTNAAVVRLMGDPKKVTQADANDDGRDDLFWRDGGTGLSWWLMNGAAVTGSTFQSVGAEWQLAGTGDFDGDGMADLVWRNSIDGSVYIWMLQGTVVGAVQTPGAVGLEWALVGVADLDGDGYSDLLFRHTTTGQLYAWLMYGATIVSQGPIATVGTEWQVVKLADLDGDGKADILWRRATDGLVYEWWMDGLSIRVAFSVAQLDPAVWSLAGVGDFNADGIADLLWRSTTGDTWVWLLDGMGGVVAGGLGNPGVSWSVKAVRDLDGDGRDDLLWRHVDGSGYLWTMKGTTVKAYIPFANPGGTWQVVAP